VYIGEQILFDKCPCLCAGNGIWTAEQLARAKRKVEGRKAAQNKLKTLFKNKRLVFQVKPSLIVSFGSVAVLLLRHAAENAEQKKIVSAQGPWKVSRLVELFARRNCLKRLSDLVRLFKSSKNLAREGSGN